MNIVLLQAAMGAGCLTAAFAAALCDYWILASVAAVCGAAWLAVLTAPLESYRPAKTEMTLKEIEDMVVKHIVKKMDEWTIRERSDGEPIGIEPPNGSEER